MGFLHQYSKHSFLSFFRENTKPNWREERKLNAETFGVRSASHYNRRGGYRGGYRGSRGRGGGRGDLMNRGTRGMGLPARGKTLVY